VARKLILCRCEDVTAADVEHAVASGFDDVEEVKRYTGFGTGPCQGKECLRAVALAIAAASGRAPEEMRPFTTRPPLAPTELGLLGVAAKCREVGGQGGPSPDGAAESDSDGLLAVRRNAPPPADSPTEREHQ
jgi:bacterioferritin-associated ferredoxin